MTEPKFFFSKMAAKVKNGLQNFNILIISLYIHILILIKEKKNVYHNSMNIDVNSIISKSVNVILYYHLVNDYDVFLTFLRPLPSPQVNNTKDERL